MINIIKIETPLGEMVAGATDEGVCLLEFSDRRMLPTEYKAPHATSENDFGRW